MLKPLEWNLNDNAVLLKLQVLSTIYQSNSILNIHCHIYVL